MARIVLEQQSELTPEEKAEQAVSNWYYYCYTPRSVVRVQ